MKRIPIKTTNRRFYRDFLEVLKSRAPIDKLRPKELDVLAEIMYQHAQLINYQKDERDDLLFSTRRRKDMRDLVGISEESFNNNLSILRKYGLITKDNRLNKSLETVVFKDKFSLEFLFIEE